jgi:hypothetical protein
LAPEGSSIWIGFSDKYITDLNFFYKENTLAYFAGVLMTKNKVLNHEHQAGSVLAYQTP